MAKNKAIDAFIVVNFIYMHLVKSAKLFFFFCSQIDQFQSKLSVFFFFFIFLCTSLMLDYLVFFFFFVLIEEELTVRLVINVKFLGH